MKTKTTDAQSVSTIHTSITSDAKQSQLLDNALPEACKVRTRSDYYYFTAIAFACAGFIIPLFFIGMAICVIKAKRGARHEK